MARIDAHQHFWKYEPAQYGWIRDPVLKRDYLPEQLRAEITGAGVAGVVSVQARGSLAETDWLLDLADRYSFIRGVVGWLPLGDPGLPEILARHAASRKLKGVRTGFPAGQAAIRGLRALGRAGLVFDLLIGEKQLPETLDLVDSCPSQVFVLDHLAKPRIKDRVISPWRENIIQLARRPNVYCKLSGMVNAADPQRWTEDDLQPYIDVALAAFGPKRLMFGSDWPVCLVASGYRRWYQTVLRAVSRLSAAERKRILGGTAAEAYKLKV